MAATENPFPSTAVARLSVSSKEIITIRTAALTRALIEMDGYLEGGDGPKAEWDDAVPDRRGSVIAIVGDYGTGKTHIALELLNRVAGTTSSRFHPLYLDAPADTFVALYRERFIPRLLRVDVRDRVEEYFADIVARVLERSKLTAGTAKELRERRAAPMDVVRHLGLMENQFMDDLKAALGQVTEKDDFGTALALFLRPEFEDAVWEWLRGESPDAVLQERGVVRTLDTDPAVLEAVGVFAFLYGHQDHRFVLVIDEMEKLLSGSSRSRSESAVLALKKLMEIMGKTGALLLMIGLPDFVDVLPEDARQRISTVVPTEGLTSDETLSYMREAMKRATGSTNLRPFSTSTGKYLNEIAGGNARKVIRLCHHGWRAAHVAGTEVTPAMLREVAREQFELSSPADVENAVIRVIDSHGWRLERDKTVADGVPLDFWLPIGGDGAACAVLLSRSILRDEEAEQLQKKGVALAAAVPTILTLLVVNGHVAEKLRPQLNESFSQVLLHSERGFYDDVDSKLKGLVKRLEDEGRESALEQVRDRLEQISRQGTKVHSDVSDLLARSVTGSALESTVQRGVRAVFGVLANAAEGDVGSLDARFPSVARLFAGALASIGAVQEPLRRSVGDMLDLGKAPDELAMSIVADRRVSAFTNPRLSTAWGNFSLMELSTRELRRAVTVVLHRSQTEPGHFGDRARYQGRQVIDRVGSVCMMYDALLRSIDIDLHEFEVLDETVERVSEHRRDRGGHRDAIERCLADCRELGHLVFDAVRRELEAGRGWD
jgi:Cdc6-like AAA superfamily ATPase